MQRDIERFRATVTAVAKQKYYTIWVCVFVALGTKNAMRMRHIVNCGLPPPPHTHTHTVFFHIIS